MFNPGSPESHTSTRSWWESKRLSYNFALLVSGAAAFVCYVFVCETLLPSSDVEISLFTTLAQGIGYLFMVGVANLCYYLGPLSEWWLQPGNVTRYRKSCYALGFWFSVLLPFIIPLGLATEALLFPHHFSQHP